MCPSQKSAYSEAKLIGSIANSNKRAGKHSCAKKLFRARPKPLSEGFPGLGQTHWEHTLQNAASNATLEDMSPMTP